MSDTPNAATNATTPDGAVILVVDDEWTNREMLRAYLKRGGYRVEEANSGEKALEVAPAVHPALIMLDVKMPGMDGYETCRKLKAADATRATPVLMVTALEDPAEADRAQDAGADGIVKKPFQAQVIFDTIASLLSGSKNSTT